MPLNIEKSGEQDKEQSKEWLVNLDHGLSDAQRVLLEYQYKIYFMNDAGKTLVLGS